MTEIITTPTLVNGLRSDFIDTYQGIRNRQKDSRLALVMGEIAATNRKQDFAYFEKAGHVRLWRRGEAIPKEAHGSIGFSAYVHNWGMGVDWHKDDLQDDQTQSLMQSAKEAGESFGLLPERLFFDLLTGTATNLPAIPLAPDGAAFFATTASSVARFGATNGNLLTGAGVATTSAVLADYYKAIVQFGAFQDGKGQPLFSPETIGQGVLIIHANADTQIMEEAFLQKRQGVGYTAAGATGTSSLVYGTTPSNIVQDASRNVQLWASPRIATGDWYVFLLGAPKKPTFLLKRQEVQEHVSTMDNSDNARKTGQEGIQWDSREGAGIALPYGAIKINN